MTEIKGLSPWEGFGRPIKWTPEKIQTEVDALLEWIKEPQNIFITKFAVHRGYSDNRIHEWKKTNEVVQEACNYLLAKQKMLLIEGGLSKKLYFPMCSLLLSNWHDMHQKTEQKVVADVTGHGILSDITGLTKDLVDECESEGP